MSFHHHISKEEIKELPLLRFEGDVRVVDDRNGIREVLQILQKERCIGFDTEKKPTFVKGQYHPTALVQLSTLHQAFLFRLSTIGFHAGLKEILESEDIIKVGISIRDDLQELKMVSPFEPRGFVDLNDVAKEIGIKRQGVRNLSAIFLEKRVSKNQQTSNWENQVLTDAQALYAATDAWVCLEIYEQLKQKGFLYNGTVQSEKY